MSEIELLKLLIRAVEDHQSKTYELLKAGEIKPQEAKRAIDFVDIILAHLGEYTKRAV